jgi:hypothetical protein
MMKTMLGFLFGFLGMMVVCGMLLIGAVVGGY